MKKDLRRQMFSKPEKPSDEEIKRVTADTNEVAVAQLSDEVANQTEPQTMEAQTPEITLVEQVGIANKNKNSAAKKPVRIEIVEQIQQASPVQNPFLLSRGQASEIVIEKTGYRVRSDYMDLMKLVKRIKKGHTLEAVLDDALTFYFENSEDGRKAVKQRELLDFE